MMHTKRKRILFLREAQENDKYESIFREHGYECSFVPVLESVSCNVDLLCRILSTDHDHYRGLIATSRRAILTLSEALHEADHGMSPEHRSQFDALWTKKPLYVVGEATAKAATELGFMPVGADSGIADVLGQKIISDYMGLPPEEGRRKLLFVAGDKRRDVLPNILTASGVPFTEVNGYETRPSSSFEHDLKHAFDSTEESHPDWMVFFSPSGVDVVFDVFQSRSWWGKVRCASIGPTTSDHLNRLQINVDAQATKPNPVELLAAVAASDNKDLV
ncbi:hypothetical protein HK102_004775 [Quaeritorhiza haematococci]|nr:hypothetical protein HK102_004775 [Quaeritorhiza haematococci]